MTGTESTDFSATFAVEGDSLVVRYEVVNLAERDLYLLDRLHRGWPIGLDPNLIYVHLDRERRTIWLHKKIPDLPEGVSVTAPYAPFVTPVRAGTAFREEVRVPIPVDDYRQYGTHAGGPSKEARRNEPTTVTYQKVYVTVGYYWRDEGVEEEVLDVDGHEVVVPRPRVRAIAAFGELESKVVALRVPVMEYRQSWFQ